MAISLTPSRQGILTPAAAPGFLSRHGPRSGEWSFGWVAMRLRAGDAGAQALRRELATVSSQPALRGLMTGGNVIFDIRRLAIAHHEAQQAIEPQAVALAVLGGLIALALLVLVGQGLAQLLARSAGDAATLRAMGATRGETAMALAVPGGLALAGQCGPGGRPVPSRCRRSRPSGRSADTIPRLARGRTGSCWAGARRPS